MTDAEIQQIIVEEVGDTPDHFIANRIAAYWQSYADKALIAPRLQELYTRRRCIMALLASPSFLNGVSFNMSGDLSLRLGERRDAMALRRKEVDEEICQVETWERQIQPPVVEHRTLAQSEIEVPPGLDPVPPSPFIDANDPIYRGDPYLSPRGLSGLTGEL